MWTELKRHEARDWRSSGDRLECMVSMRVVKNLQMEACRVWRSCLVIISSNLPGNDYRCRITKKRL
jgi:hypothetical protein